MKLLINPAIRSKSKQTTKKSTTSGTSVVSRPLKRHYVGTTYSDTVTVVASSLLLGSLFDSSSVGYSSMNSPVDSGFDGGGGSFGGGGASGDW